VEDNDEMRDYLKSSLQSDFQVITACNGKEGLKQAQMYFPDLVLSDILMPEADGFTLCKMFKSDILTSHIPIILLTALSTENYEIKGIEQGADVYLTKPFNLQVLRSHIYNLIETRRRLRISFASGKSTDEKAATRPSLDMQFLEKAEQFVLERISDPALSSLQLAQEVCMSRTTLHRKLKSLTNMSATQFIKNVRLNKSIIYIQEGAMNIDEVATRVGFNATTYFSTCFKEKYGISPSEYKRAVLNKLSVRHS
jgi:YesN/AraC family two-component response regulator